MATNAKAASDRLRRALYRRMQRRIRDALEQLSDEALLEAVEEPTATATVAWVLAAAPESAPDGWGHHLLRGAAAKAEMLRDAGGVLSTGEAAQVLGLTPQAIQQRRARGTVLALPLANGEWGYPACQFGPEGRVRDGIPRVLAAFGTVDPWVVLGVLLSPDAPGEARWADVLDDPAAVGALEELARTYGAQGAA